MHKTRKIKTRKIKGGVDNNISNNSLIPYLKKENKIVIKFNENDFIFNKKDFMKESLKEIEILKECDVENNIEYINFSNFGINNSGIINIQELDIFNKESNNSMFQLKEVNDTQIKKVYPVISENYKKLLQDYTTTDGLYRMINMYLINPVDFINKTKQNEDYMNETEYNEEYIENAINKLDKIFQYHADIINEPLTVYRGIREEKYNIENNKTFISTSRDKNIAIRRFTNFDLLYPENIKTFDYEKNYVKNNKINKNKTSNYCCLLICTIFPGVPILDLAQYSTIPLESEILLPRGLDIRIINTEIVNDMKTLYVDIKPSNQFNLIEKCKEYKLLQIEVIKNSNISKIRKMFNV